MPMSDTKHARAMREKAAQKYRQFFHDLPKLQSMPEGWKRVQGRVPSIDGCILICNGRRPSDPERELAWIGMDAYYPWLEAKQKACYDRCRRRRMDARKG